MYLPMENALMTWWMSLGKVQTDEGRGKQEEFGNNIYSFHLSS